MKDRIRAVRAGTNLNQADFGKAIGVTLSAVQKWELGLAEPRQSVLMNISSRFGIREEWLRTGEGEMYSESSVAAELSAMVGQLFRDRPETFKARLIATLLRYDPDGPQWRLLEEIYSSVAAEAGPSAGVLANDRAALHAELDRQLDDEERGASSA